MILCTELSRNAFERQRVQEHRVHHQVLPLLKVDRTDVPPTCCEAAPAAVLNKEDEAGFIVTSSPLNLTLALLQLFTR